MNVAGRRDDAAAADDDCLRRHFTPVFKADANQLAGPPGSKGLLGFPSSRRPADNSLMPNPSNSRNKVSNEDQGSGETYVSKAWLRNSPAVTVRGGPNLTITFNAALSKALGLARFRYAAVRHDAKAKIVQFILGNDEAAHGGAFTLGFNGGSSKKKGSPSRCIQAPGHRLPFLELGAYRPRATWDDRETVVSIDLTGKI